MPLISKTRSSLIIIPFPSTFWYVKHPTGFKSQSHISNRGGYDSESVYLTSFACCLAHCQFFLRQKRKRKITIQTAKMLKPQLRGSINYFKVDFTWAKLFGETGQGRVSVRMPEQEVDSPPHPPHTLHLLTEREDGARQGDGELSGGKGEQSMQGME